MPPRLFAFALFALIPSALGLGGAAAAAGVDAFADGVWAKVARSTCLKCHKAGGDAEESAFLLRDPARAEDPDAAMAHNRRSFVEIADASEADGRPRVLLKATGGLDHGGEDVLELGSERYRELERFVRTARGEDASDRAGRGGGRPFLDGVEMVSDARLLRRLTLSLAARLPTDAERAAVARGGLGALGAVLDAAMEEEAFYDRLAEGFEDIFLTTGIDDNAETVLSYEHFEKTRLWYQRWDFSDIEDEKERQRAGWRLADQYREAIAGEPAALIKHIVREGRPFTEILTADYIMVTPFSARGYGVYNEVEDRFADPDDYLEYVPVRIAALKGRSRATDQESATGFYPHAGLLSTFQYLRRYPTTETNRNRLRVRMFYQHFLGVDVLALAPRVSDAATASLEHEVPTMQAADCVVCHKIIDPVAGVFQDYYALDGKGVYLRRKEGWFTDMFAPGFEGEALPEAERWRALQWLAERASGDPRFAVAMVEHVWYILSGRRPSAAPEDVAHPLFDARQRAYREQRRELERIARGFAADGFDLKGVFKALALSPFYRADGLAAALADPAREAELADLGLARLLSPEQLERKLAAVFGRDWGRLTGRESFLLLYGGIDSKEITERIADPSGAMGAIQRMMANEMACKTVALDFAKDPGERLLFPGVEPDLVPSPDNEPALRAAIAHLHAHVLGREDAPGSEEVSRTYALFAGVVGDARERGRFEGVDIYHCRADGEHRVPDPEYTVRAWRAVLTYLLRRQEFLYE